MLPPLTPAMLRRAAAGFKRDTAVTDGWSPRHFEHLSQRALDLLAALLREVERLGAFTSSQRGLLVCLIPKPDGDRRPIGLYLSLHRLWARARRQQYQCWQREHAPDHMVNMAAGRCVGDAVWRASARNVLATACDLISLEADWDVEKCYEHVEHHILADLAARLSFLLLLVRAYSA